MKEERYRLYQYMTRTEWLHVKDALSIGKLRLFAGSYQRGQGAQTTAYHYLDVADARVLFADVAAGVSIDYCDFKGTPNSEGPQSRVFKVKSQGKGDKVWFRLENGPGEVIGQGAIKPKGEPQAVVNIPFESWKARKLALAVLSYLQAADVLDIMRRQAVSSGPSGQGTVAGWPTVRADHHLVSEGEVRKERPSRARRSDHRPVR
jgi:hypothetical protein